MGKPRCDGKARDDAGNIVEEYPVEKTGKLRHGMIDNCMVCAPRWGQVEEIAPVDIERAKREGLAVPYGRMSRAIRTEADGAVLDGRAEKIHVTKRTRGASVSYLVVRWKKGS